VRVRYPTITIDEMRKDLLEPVAGVVILQE
jgi:hypothetical protein